MKEKIVTAIVACVVFLFALIPNFAFKISLLANTNLWFFFALVSGALGFVYLYGRAHILLKIALIFLFFNAIVGKAPYLSLTAYFWLIICAYFYLLCLEIKDYGLIYKAIQTVFFVNVGLIVLQLLGYDKLLNFGREQATYIGTMGNTMMQGSFLVVLAPYLIQHKRLNIIPLGLAIFLSKSFGAVVSYLSGLFFYLNKRWRIFLVIAVLICSFIYKDKIVVQYKAGRWPVWKKCVQLMNDHPFMGHGIGTFRVIFPVLSKDVAGGITYNWKYEGTQGSWLAWRQAHNVLLQTGFETGYIGILLFGSFFGWLFYKLRKDKLLGGLVMITVNLLVHFPDRMIQSAPMLILFLAICQRRANYGHDPNM